MYFLYFEVRAMAQHDTFLINQVIQFLQNQKSGKNRLHSLSAK